MSVRGSISLECEARVMIDEKTYVEMKDFYLSKAKSYKSFTNKNIYIDTEGLYLVNHHMVLRIREIDESKAELTLKVGGNNGDTEYNYSFKNAAELDYFIKNLDIPYDKIKEALLENNIDLSKLKIITTLVTERIEIPHRTYLFVIDKNYYDDIIDYNLEVEADSLAKAIRNLNRLGKLFNVKYKKGYVSKSHRAVLR